MNNEYKFRGKRLNSGFRDSNGVEIHEGDIVKFTCYGCPYVDVVKLEKWGFYPMASVAEEIALSADGGVEVIGNIHDTPELLEANR